MAAAQENQEPPDAEVPGERRPGGFLQHVDAIRDDIDKLRDLKLYGTGDRVARWSTFLREDIQGRSLDLSRDTVPTGWLDRHESYTVAEGRVYSFSRAEYPLFFELMESQDQKYERVLDDELVARIVAFAEESLALAGFPTAGSPAPR